MKARSKLGASIAWVACACVSCGVSQPSPEDPSSATRSTAAEVQRSPDVEPPPWHDEATSNALPEVATSDAQIVAALEAVVGTDLGLARVALQRARSGDVRDLASHTVEEFGGAQARLAEAASLHAVRRAETPAVAALRASAVRSMTQLLAATPADFDAAFLRTLALTSTQQIAALDQLPGDARWAELRAEVADMHARLAAAVAATRRLEERR